MHNKQVATKNTLPAHARGMAAAILIIAAAAFSCVAQTAAHHPPDTAPVKPEAVGFSSERLENLHALIQGEIDQKQLAGAVTILARHGKIVDYRTYGQRDIATSASMTRDVIFRDYSMTKPVTGVAMMILYEEGKWLPSDPIAKYIPEFAHLKVFKGVDGDGKIVLVDPDHPPTMRELMSHSAGFSYGNGHTVVDAMYHDQKVMQSANLQEMIDKLATIPLNYQPGKGWTYSVSMDIEGYIVEKLSGQTLPDFMRDHIFVPLDMKDAGFFVPQEKRLRFATNYRDDPQGNLVPVQTSGGPPTDYATQPMMPSGGGGLVSTAEDYYHFAQMLGNGGEFDDKRILAPATVNLESPPGEPAHRRVRHRPAHHAARLRLRLQLRRCVRSVGRRSARRQGHFLLGRRGRDLVLGRSHQRYCLRGDDSAHDQSR